MSEPVSREDATTGSRWSILDDIRSYEAPTRESIIEFLSGEYGTERRSARARPTPLAGARDPPERRRSETADLPCSSYRLTPSGATLLEALRQLTTTMSSVPRIQTQCKAMDTLTDGGLATGTITQIFGEKALGKSIISFQTACAAVASGSSAIILDTEQSYG